MIGYSWKTNQYGLTVDTLTAFELVLPTGEVKVVTENDEDLWFALKVRPSTCYGGRVWSYSRLIYMSGRTEQLRELTEKGLLLCR